jgi:hypothetical protein
MRRLLCLLALCGGCAESEPEERAERPAAPVRARIRFVGDAVWVTRGEEQWKLPAPRDEVFLSPSQTRYAVVDLDSGSPPTQVVVRSLKGRVVARCALAAPAMPRDLAWLDDKRLAYFEPRGGAREVDAWRIHDAATGRLVAERAGSDFAWDPARAHLAYVNQEGALAVDAKTIYPRLPLPGARVRGPLAWGPDGHGLAFVELGRMPRLVVVLELEDESGDLTWPIPKEATAPSLRVFWATPSKVVIGEDPMQPKFAADWVRER